MKSEGRRVFPAYYAMLWRTCTDVAHKLGYCLALHGSLARDMDILAVPWTREAVPRSELVHALVERIGLFGECEAHNPAAKPHGRLAWALQLQAGAYIDLSVMPRFIVEEPHPQEEVTGAD